MSTHTKGPWKISGSLGSIDIKSETVHVGTIVHGRIDDEGKANAHLIAASPTMLTLLKKLANRDSYSDNGYYMKVDGAELWDIAAELVQSIEGGE